MLLQKGFYHRNVNFQSYVDHKHQEFVSGSRACVDPPHLRMVFDEPVVSSLATKAAAPVGETSPVATQLCRDHAVLASDSSKTCFEDTNAKLCSNQHKQDCQSSIAFAGDGACQQRQDAEAAKEAEPRFSDCKPAVEAKGKDNTWQDILQQSMALARDTRWTHKGLQVSLTSS